MTHHKLGQLLRWFGSNGWPDEIYDKIIRIEQYCNAMEIAESSMPIDCYLEIHHDRSQQVDLIVVTKISQANPYTIASSSDWKQPIDVLSRVLGEEEGLVNLKLILEFDFKRYTNPVLAGVGFSVRQIESLGAGTYRRFQEELTKTDRLIETPESGIENTLNHLTSQFGNPVTIGLMHGRKPYSIKTLFEITNRDGEKIARLIEENYQLLQKINLIEAPFTKGHKEMLSSMCALMADLPEDCYLVLSLDLETATGRIHDRICIEIFVHQLNQSHRKILFDKLQESIHLIHIRPTEHSQVMYKFNSGEAGTWPRGKRCSLNGIRDVYYADISSIKIIFRPLEAITFKTYFYLHSRCEGLLECVS
jgi:hypothetical protein